MEAAALAFGASRGVDQIGDGFDMIDAHHSELRQGSVGRDDDDCTDAEHTFDQALRDGHVVDVDRFNAIDRSANDATLVE